MLSFIHIVTSAERSRPCLANTKKLSINHTYKYSYHYLLLTPFNKKSRYSLVLSKGYLHCISIFPNSLCLSPSAFRIWWAIVQTSCKIMIIWLVFEIGKIECTCRVSCGIFVLTIAEKPTKSLSNNFLGFKKKKNSYITIKIWFEMVTISGSQIMMWAVLEAYPLLKKKQVQKYIISVTPLHSL